MSIKLRNEKNKDCKSKFLSNTKANESLNLSSCLLVRLTVSFVKSETKLLTCWLNFVRVLSRDTSGIVFITLITFIANVVLLVYF